LEETTKRKWRKEFSVAEKCHFSKASRIIEAIKLQANRENKDTNAIVAEWNNEMMSEKGKFTITSMIKWLTEKGFVGTKKTRGVHVRK